MNPTPNPHATLIASLQNPALYDHPVEKFEIVETHISTVLLTGRYAYKIKKPLNLGFLDFSTLEQRHHFCNEELRLNRRLAPQLYLNVVAIGGSAIAPVLNSGGAAIEYAVKMRQFDQQMSPCSSICWNRAPWRISTVVIRTEAHRSIQQP